MRRNSFASKQGFAIAPQTLGGSSSVWTQLIDESGASFANFAGIKGTWLSDGTIIKSTDTAAGAFLSRANHVTKVVLSGCVIQMEVRLPSAGQGATPNYIGFYPGMNLLTTNTLGLPMITIERAAVAANSTISWRDDGVVPSNTVTVTINYDTWYTLKTVFFGARASIYLDGVLVATFVVPGYKTGENSSDVSYLGLMSYGALAHYRNIKVWNLTEP